MPYRILFVCMGNICRSPTAHGVMRAHVQAAGWQAEVEVDSAGTHNYHPDSPPDMRSQHHARLRGYELADLRARQIAEEDYEHFDLILAMDWDNLALVEQRCPPQHRRKVRRLAEFFQNNDSAVVPDPYYGGAQGFEQVLDLIEDGCDGVLQHIERLGLAAPR